MDTTDQHVCEYLCNTLSRNPCTNEPRHVRPGGLKWLVYHGQKRQEMAAELHNNDVVLTTYDTLRSDWATYGPLYACSWARIILDEGMYETLTFKLQDPLAF